MKLGRHSSILDLEDAQVKLHLLRSCHGVCKINHLLRTVPPHLVEEELHTFDQGLRSTLFKILKCPVSDKSWRQASLPFTLGGMGLREAPASAMAAFINSTRILAVPRRGGGPFL